MPTVFKRAKDRKIRGSKWIVSWFDAERHGWRQVTGYTDKELSLDKGRRLEDAAARRAEGVVNSIDLHKQAPIEGHLRDFVAGLAARNRDTSYVEQVQNRIERLINGTGAKRLADLDPVAIDRFLLGLRVKRKPLAPVTRNEYVTSIRGFTRWAVESRRLDIDPLVSLKRTERRAIRLAHPRRALAPDEVSRLLEAAVNRPLIELQTVRTGKRKGQLVAKVSDRVREKALRIGRSRRLAYLLAVWAGLRRSEIVALEWRDIELDSPSPRITLRAEATKSRRADSVVLHPELAEALRSSQPAVAKPTDRVVPKVQGMAAIRADLRLAGIAPGDATTGFVDFHALRKTLSTTMAAAGMSQRTRQAHMRHTDPRLTEGTYLDERLLPIAAELVRLPFFGERNGTALTQNAHKTVGSSGQNGASRGTAGQRAANDDFRKSEGGAHSQVALLAELGTNEQGPTLRGVEPFQKRVMGLEPTTFTLAT